MVPISEFQQYFEFSKDISVQFSPVSVEHFTILGWMGSVPFAYVMPCINPL